MENWYALFTRPRHEKQVAHSLESAGIEAYLPTYRATSSRRAGNQCEKPFFPRYLFAHLDLGTLPLSSVNWMPGMTAVVSFGAQPVVVPDEVLTWLRQSLAQLDAAGHLTGAPLQSGDLVRITAGPLQDMYAVFDRQLTAAGRVRVLVRLLRRLAACEVDLAHLERA